MRNWGSREITLKILLRPIHFSEKISTVTNQYTLIWVWRIFQQLESLSPVHLIRHNQARKVVLQVTQSRKSSHWCRNPWTFYSPSKRLKRWRLARVKSSLWWKMLSHSSRWRVKIQNVTHPCLWLDQVKEMNLCIECPVTEANLRFFSCRVQSLTPRRKSWRLEERNCSQIICSQCRVFPLLKLTIRLREWPRSSFQRTLCT